MQSCVAARTTLPHPPALGCVAAWSEDNVIAVPGDSAITLLHAADVQRGRMLVPLVPQSVGPSNEALVKCLHGATLERTDVASLSLPCRHAALHGCAAHAIKRT